MTSRGSVAAESLKQGVERVLMQGGCRNRIMSDCYEAVNKDKRDKKEESVGG
jgi:hypothetical protein